MWKWAVKRKKNKQGGWWEDGGETKGIWGKEVNWEPDNMMDSTEVFSYFIIYSLLPYLEALFLKRNLKKCFEGGIGASGKQREKSIQISSSLACRQSRGIILGKCGSSQLALATQLNVQFLCFCDVQKYNISRQIQGSGGTSSRGEVACGLAEGLWQPSASSPTSTQSGSCKFSAWCYPGMNSHGLGKGSRAATAIITSKEEMMTEDWKEKPWKSTKFRLGCCWGKAQYLSSSQYPAVVWLCTPPFSSHVYWELLAASVCVLGRFLVWFLKEMRRLQSP